MEIIKKAHKRGGEIADACGVKKEIKKEFKF